MHLHSCTPYHSLATIKLVSYLLRILRSSSILCDPPSVLMPTCIMWVMSRFPFRNSVPSSLCPLSPALLLPLRFTVSLSPSPSAIFSPLHFFSLFFAYSSFLISSFSHSLSFPSFSFLSLFPFARNIPSPVLFSQLPSFFPFAFSLSVSLIFSSSIFYHSSPLLLYFLSFPFPSSQLCSLLLFHPSSFLFPSYLPTFFLPLFPHPQPSPHPPFFVPVLSPHLPSFTPVLLSSPLPYS